MAVIKVEFEVPDEVAEKFERFVTRNYVDKDAFFKSAILIAIDSGIRRLERDNGRAGDLMEGHF